MLKSQAEFAFLKTTYLPGRFESNNLHGRFLKLMQMFPAEHTKKDEQD